MPNFKVGDKVRRIHKLEDFPLSDPVCTVSHVRATGSIELQELKNGYAYNNEFFELVKEPKFKVGDFIKCTNDNHHSITLGKIYQVVGTDSLKYSIGTEDEIVYINGDCGEVIGCFTWRFEKVDPVIKVGDIVKRIEGIYKGMKPGDTDIVTNINFESVSLGTYGVGHSLNKFEKVDVTTSVKETLTKAKTAMERFDKVASAFDQQVAGNHYKTLGVQPLEACYLNRGYEAFSGACYTKVLKYMDRKKDNRVEQLKKARHVLDMWIEKAEQQ